jgi:hypothetical protein
MKYLKWSPCYRICVSKIKARYMDNSNFPMVAFCHRLSHVMCTVMAFFNIFRLQYWQCGLYCRSHENFWRREGTFIYLRYHCVVVCYSGLSSRFTKLPTPTPQFLKLWHQLLHKISFTHLVRSSSTLRCRGHKISICINNGKSRGNFITTTSIIRLLFWLTTYI